jgi:hypothetical protein
MIGLSFFMRRGDSLGRPCLVPVEIGAIWDFFAFAEALIRLSWKRLCFTRNVPYPVPDGVTPSAGTAEDASKNNTTTTTAIKEAVELHTKAFIARIFSRVVI